MKLHQFRPTNNYHFQFPTKISKIAKSQLFLLKIYANDEICFIILEMFYSGVMRGFHILREYWTNSGSIEGLFKAALCYCSWMVSDTGWNKFVMFENENSFGDPIST